MGSVKKTTSTSDVQAPEKLPELMSGTLLQRDKTENKTWVNGEKSKINSWQEQSNEKLENDRQVLNTLTVDKSKTSTTFVKGIIPPDIVTTSETVQLPEMVSSPTKIAKLPKAQNPDRECLTANKPPLTADNASNKYSAANKEDQIAIFQTFKKNPAFNNKFSEAVMKLDSTKGITESQRNAKKEIVYKEVEKDFKLAILSLSPNSKTIQNLSMLSKSELKQEILKFIVATKPKYEGITDISELPANKQKLIESIVNGIHDAFPNKVHGNVTIKAKIKDQVTDIDVPATIKIKGVEYKNPQHIASGGLGHALRYTDPNGKTVVVKQLIFSPEVDEQTKLEKRNEMISEFKAHLNAAGDSGHKNIAGLKGIAIGDNDSLYMVLDEAKGGGMNKLSATIKDNVSISENTRELLQKRILKDVMTGVGHIHDMGIKHLDLKDANIFVNEDGTSVLGDFGQARTDNFVTGNFKTTDDIRSPELHSSDKVVSKESDTWAVGMMAYKMFEGNSNRFFYQSKSTIDSYESLGKFAENNNNRVYVTGNEIEEEAGKKLELLRNKKSEIEEQLVGAHKNLKEVVAKYTDIPEDGRLETIQGLLKEAREEAEKALDVVNKLSTQEKKEKPELLSEYNLKKEKYDKLTEKFSDYNKANINIYGLNKELTNISGEIANFEEHTKELIKSAKKDHLEPKHEIVNALMHPDPTKRPDINDVLKHSYFQDPKLESPQMKELMKELLKKPENQDQQKIKNLSDEIDNL
jgi:serine/threonine protein kinase